jgi:lysophospholipase L1-like esterase
MPQLTETSNLPPAPFTGDSAVFVDSTIRQTVHSSIPGRKVRIRFSNTFGDTALTINAAHIALPAGGAAGVSAIDPKTDRPLLFQGNASVTIPTGAQVVSDPIVFPVAARSNVAVTVYTEKGQQSKNVTSHPGSRTTSYFVAGDHVTDADLTGAANVNHWYFLSGLEVWTDNSTAGLIIVGDSLTDGRGSTTNQNDRWPNQLDDMLEADRSTTGIAVLNQAAGGNRVMNDGLGPNVMARLDRDLLAQVGVRWAILFEGVNDIGTADATDEAQKKVADELIRAFQQIIIRAHAKNILVFGATITPFGGNGYADETGFREAARQTVNKWIRTSGKFDAVIDFDKAVRDPANPAALLTDYDVGDHLHMNPNGYKALASAVHPGLFWHRQFPGMNWRFGEDPSEF